MRMLKEIVPPFVSNDFCGNPSTQMAVCLCTIFVSIICFLLLTFFAKKVSKKTSHIRFFH